MSAGLLLVIYLAQLNIQRRNNQPRHAPAISQSRDMSSTLSVDPRLAEHASQQCRNRKERFLTSIKSVLKRKKNRKEGEKWGADLGLDSWDGFAWAEQRQDGQRVKRVWDYTKKEWVVVPNLGLERSVSPCDMRREVTEEEEEHEHDSFYAARTTVGSPAEIDDARRSTSERSDDTDATIRPSMLTAVHSDDTLCPEQTNDSDAIIRLSVTATEENATARCPNVLATDESSKATRLSPLANKRISLRRAAIWNSARLSGRKGLDFWKFGSRRSHKSRSVSNVEEEPLLGSLKGTVTNLPANPSRSDLDGLAKLLGSIDSERANSVRHIWHEEMHEWTHVRTAGPSSS